MQSVVVASLERLPDGGLRLVFDDAVREESRTRDTWTKRSLFTHLDLPAAADDVPDPVLTDIAFNLIVRLRAANGLEV